MKEEKEYSYLCRLYNSKYVKILFKISCYGSLSDFEKVCKVREKDKPFRAWVRKLIEERVFEVGKIENGYPKYFINEKLLLKKIEKHNLYSEVYKKPHNSIYEGVLRH